MSSLFIVESPGKVEKIQHILDDLYPHEFVVRASVGHVCDLPNHEIGFSYPAFVPKYEISQNKTRVVQELRQAAKNADTVFLATDLDREGEAIAYHLKRILNLSDDQYIRVKYNAIDKTTIANALQNGEELDQGMVASQETRRFLDRMIGFYLYEPISNILKGKFPVGRVQSAVLVVLGDLEDLLKNFKSHEHYNLEVTLKQGWAAKWDFSKWLNPEMKDVHNNQWLDKASITRLQSEIDKKDLTITSVETKPSFRSAPAPFITVDLQAAAAARLGLDLKQTMEAAQKLYEGGYITYHRTDAAVISPEGMQALEAFGEREGIAIIGNKAKSRDGAQEAHECIRPSDFFTFEAGEDKVQKDLYRLIWLRTVASQMAPAEYEVKSVVGVYKDVTLNVDGESITKDAEFKASSRILKEDGWLGLLKTYSIDENALEYVDGEEDSEKEPEHTLPMDIEVGQNHNVIAGKVIATKTKPRSRYTVPSLVKLLEKKGIGRPSTYQSIFERLIKHGYIKLVKKKIEVTPHGLTLIQNIRGKFSFADPLYTKEIEETLDLIATGDADYKQELQKFHLGIESELGQFSKHWLDSFPVYKCNNCDDGRMLPKIGTNRDKTTSVYWSCNSCKSSAPNRNVDGKDEPGKPTVRESTAHLCLCGKTLTQVTTDKSVFFECSQRAFVDGTCKETYRSTNDESGNLVPDFDEYRRNHTYKCQLEGCGGWLRELKGISTSSGKPYHFFSCEKSNPNLKGKKCKSGPLEVFPDGSPNYEPRFQVTKTEYPCICKKPLVHTKYRKEPGVYEERYSCEAASCKRYFDILPDGSPDTQLTKSRTGNEAKCFECGQTMIQSAFNLRGERKFKWDCFSCGASGYDNNGEPVQRGKKKAKSKSTSTKAKSSK